MKFIKRLFCKHLFVKKPGYVNIGWEICLRCEKERYNDNELEFTHFKL